jgi:hypothetical protein
MLMGRVEKAGMMMTIDHCKPAHTLTVDVWSDLPVAK